MATYRDRQQIFPIPLLAHSKQLFKSLDILTVHDIYKLQLGLIVYKAINKIGPSQNFLKFKFAQNIHDYNTRFAERFNLYREYSRTSRYGLRRVTNEGAKLWNEINQDIRTKNNYFLFKKTYKLFLLSEYI